MAALENTQHRNPKMVLYTRETERKATKIRYMYVIRNTRTQIEDHARLSNVNCEKSSMIHRVEANVGVGYKRHGL